MALTKQRITIYVTDEMNQDLWDIADNHDWSRTKAAEKILEAGIKLEKTQGILNSDGGKKKK
ncbi:MAG: hypothetical protein KDK36_15550 [Leptospiraceae bacterium]|nr:hypothetical protein [Leptospiraceae bacterium]